MSGATLRSLECWTVSVPLPRTIQLGDVEVRSREFVFVRLTDSEGAYGVAYGMTRNAPVATVLATMVWPHVAGMPSHDIPGIRAALDRRLVTQGAAGIVQRAISALDIALWDLAGSSSGRPVWQLLGADAAAAPSLMVVADYQRADESTRDYAARVACYAQQGFRAIKLYPPESLTDLPALVHAVRDALPAAASTQLMVDMAWLWRSAGEAVEQVRSWDALELGWVEDPLPADRVDALRQLTTETRTTIAAGDELSIPVVAAALIEKRAVDVLRLDSTTIGGVSTVVQLLESARTAQIPASLHAYPEIHRHVAAAFSDVVTLIERFPEYSPYWGVDSFLSVGTAIQPTGPGHELPLPSEPGLGIEVDWARVESYSVESFRLEGLLG